MARVHSQLIQFERPDGLMVVVDSWAISSIQQGNEGNSTRVVVGEAGWGYNVKDSYTEAVEKWTRALEAKDE